jgi:hypothetical protein
MQELLAEIPGQCHRGAALLLGVKFPLRNLRGLLQWFSQQNKRMHIQAGKQQNGVPEDPVLILSS